MLKTEIIPMQVWPVAGEAERFFVGSRSRPHITHIVDSNWEGGWGCSCEQFQVRGLECPHIQAVKERMRLSSNSGTQEL